MEKTIYGIKITFIEPLLGSQASREITTSYIATKTTPQDELAALTAAEEMEKRTTVFHRGEDGKPILFDYQVKGFFKEAASAVKEFGTIKQLKSKVETYIFIQPRQIKIVFPGQIEIQENPLRGMTAQGPRISLSRKERIKDATLECQIVVLGKIIKDELVQELLNYGKYMGIGQWRSGGFGRFRYELAKHGEK